MTVQTVQKSLKGSMNDVLKISLAQVAEMVNKEQGLDEAQAGYLAGYLDCIRAKAQEQKED